MILRSWTLSPDDWARASAKGPEDAIVMASSPRHAALARASADLPGGTSWSAYDTGHVFTGAWHAKWRHLGTTVRVVIAGEAPFAAALAAPGDTRDLTAMETESTQIVLWGRRQTGESMWVELRVPHLMTPPTQHPHGHEPPGEHKPPEESASTEAQSVETDLAAAGSEKAESVDYHRRVIEGTLYRDPETKAACFTQYRRLRYAASDTDDTTFRLMSSD